MLQLWGRMGNPVHGCRSIAMQHRGMWCCVQVWRHNWHQLASVYALARNVLRVTRILMWLLLCILRWNLMQPFHMIK